MKRIFVMMIFILVSLGTEIVQGQELFWANKAGNGGSDIAYDISLDGDGNILISGRIWGRADFNESASLISSGTNDIFVAKYTSEGALIWARRAGSPHTYTYADGDDVDDGEAGYAVAADRFGNVLVAGQFVGTAEFDGISLSTGRVPGPRTGNNQSPFLAKYRSSGTPIWVRRFEGFGERGGSTGRGTGVGADQSGNVYFAGTSEHECDPPDDSGSRWCGQYGFLEKYDPSGRIVWRRHVGGRAHQGISDLAVDDAGNVVVCGGFNTIVHLDERTSLTTDAPGGFFIAKYDPDGRVLWAKKAEGNDFAQYSRSIALDHSGNVIVTGSFQGRLTFDGRRDLASRGGSDIFVAKYNSAGAFLWVERAGGSYDPPRVVITDIGTSVATDGGGNILVGGVFKQNASFDGMRIDATGPEDGFIAKYSPDGSLLWVKRIGGTSYVEVNGVIAGSDGRIFATGYFTETFGEGEVTLRSAGSGDIWVAELGYVPRSDGEIAEVEWEHIHALCPEEVRRALLDPDVRCPGVFENSPPAPIVDDPRLVVPRGAEEIWTMAITDRSLHSLDDADRYGIALPDPGSSIYPGHDDIRPSTGPFRETIPQPMPECDTLQRIDPGPAGRDRTTNVSLVGTLTIEVVPSHNSLSDRPVGTGGEGIRIYRDDAFDDILADGTRIELTVVCPRSSLGLRTINFTFGERTGDRPLGATGGYELHLEYRIEIQREFPGWVSEEPDRRGYRGFGSIPCLQLSLPGDSPLGPGPGLFPNESFPFCAPGGIDWARVTLPHPLDASRSRDIAGQPPIAELFALRWPVTDTHFNLIFTSGSDLSFRLLDANGKLVGEAIALTREFEDKPFKGKVSRLSIQKLPAGTYFLEIEGASAEYTIEFTPPDVQYGVPKEFLKFYIGNSN